MLSGSRSCAPGWLTGRSLTNRPVVPPWAEQSSLFELNSCPSMCMSWTVVWDHLTSWSVVLQDQLTIFALKGQSVILTSESKYIPMQTTVNKCYSKTDILQQYNIANIVKSLFNQCNVLGWIAFCCWKKTLQETAQRRKVSKKLGLFGWWGEKKFDKFEKEEEKSLEKKEKKKEWINLKTSSRAKQNITTIDF